MADNLKNDPSRQLNPSVQPEQRQRNEQDLSKKNVPQNHDVEQDDETQDDLRRAS